MGPITIRQFMMFSKICISIQEQQKCAGLRDKSGTPGNATITSLISQGIRLIGAARPMLEVPHAPTQCRRLRPQVALLGTTVLTVATARQSLPLILRRMTMLELAARVPLRLVNLRALPLGLSL